MNTDGMVRADYMHLLVQCSVLLDGRRLSVGRDADNDIILDNPTVSRHHAILEPSESGHVITDLGSHNGTRVNGTLITAPRRLAPGDEIRLGRSWMRYRVAAGDDDGTRPVEPLPDLTRRERQVLTELCRPLGLGTLFTEPSAATDIARALRVSEAAVRNVLSRLYVKFDVVTTAPNRRALLATEAVERGAISTTDLGSGMPPGAPGSP